MKKLTGLILSAVFLTGILAGCAGTPAGNNTSTSENTTAISDTNTPEPAQSEETAFPFTYTDARGKDVTIEKKPERIASVTWMITENLFALETPPVAADTWTLLSEWASMKEYFQKYQVESLGESHTEINLEKLLEIKPDLILATTANEKIYEQLEKIAPVIVFDSGVLFADWQNSIREIAKVVGEETAAENFIDTTTVQVAEGREKIAQTGKTVGFLRVISKSFSAFGIGQLSMYYDTEKGLGLTVPQGWAEEGAELSLEGLSEINPDYLFVSGGEDQEYMDELSKNSVWNSLTAVKEGHVYPIDLSGLTGGPLATKYGVQTVLDALAE